jgi:inhibitor of cysteine peptidase
MKYLIIIFLMLACSSSDKLSESRKAQKNLILTEKDSGRTITLNRKDTLKITLKANNTTGYQWSVSDIDTTILKKIDSKYTPLTVSNNVVGSGGKFSISFTPLKKGQSLLELIYHRSFEKNTQPEKKFNLIVIAK